MNTLNSIVARIPASSESLKLATVFSAGVTVTSFAAESLSYLGWGGAITTFAFWAVMNVKQVQEKKLQREVAAATFSAKFLGWLEECINSKNNPFTVDVRNQMIQLIGELRTHGRHIREGNDDFRAPFVGTQGAMEHILAAQKTLQTVTSILGAIHTPTPATPLCTRVDGQNVDKLIDPSLRHDQDKLTTITERAVTIRRMLAQKGTVLYAIYPEGGLQKRKSEEQAIFLGEVKNHPGKLKTSVLSCAEIDPSCVGAIYFFTDEAGIQYVISIKAQQAINPLENSTWGIWFGVITNPEIHRRVQEISKYISTHNGPDLPQEFLNMCIHDGKRSAAQ